MFLPLSESDYAANWQIESSRLMDDGAYKWMAAELGSGVGTWILELGCGTGAGTAAIVARGARVVSIEANPNAVRITLKFLLGQGIRAETCSPAALKDRLGETNSSVYIVEADICDGAIKEHLPKGFFSGIACWLIGAAPSTTARVLGPEYGAVSSKIGEKAQDGPRVLREKVHQRTYDLASQTLIKGGAIVCVDRNDAKLMNDPRMAAELERYHRECANGRCNVHGWRTTAWLAPEDFGTSKIGIGANSPIDRYAHLSLYLTRFLVGVDVIK